MAEKKPVEKFWKELVDVYFQFYKIHFRDEDGFQLSPDWSPHKVGMESKGLKEIIIRLRTIAEEKNIEWNFDYAKNSLSLFFEKAYNIQFLKKSFMCCLLNKYKDQVIVSENNSHLVSSIVDLWYREFPDYARSDELDKKGAEIILGFFKQNYIRANLLMTQKSILSSMLTIIKHIREEEFWIGKSLRSVANNMQEFVNKIKSKHGTDKAFTREGLAQEFSRRYSK